MATAATGASGGQWLWSFESFAACFSIFVDMATANTCRHPHTTLSTTLMTLRRSSPRSCRAHTLSWLTLPARLRQHGLSRTPGRRFLLQCPSPLCGWISTSVARTFPAVDDAARGFRRLYPNIPDDRLRSFVSEGLRQVDGGWKMKLDPATYETWEPGDLRPVLSHIALPTLVLRGAESIVTSTEGLTALANGLPSREVREIKGGSHMLLLEHPEEVAVAIRDFIRRYVVR